ncbi:unnamed protein product [Vicia faba]|uniref:Uncharacterized protein n=1 Tax=Vicia faba TaxID=3906 RepID=A0AAV0ZW61_VICFA|nr:unnamed protein product [Vicia faba]
MIRLLFLDIFNYCSWISTSTSSESEQTPNTSGKSRETSKAIMKTSWFLTSIRLLSEVVYLTTTIILSTPVEMNYKPLLMKEIPSLNPPVLLLTNTRPFLLLFNKLLCLNSNMHLPSVPKLTMSLDCHLIFNSLGCIIHGSHTPMTIGASKLDHGL